MAALLRDCKLRIGQFGINPSTVFPTFDQAKYLLLLNMDARDGASEGCNYIALMLCKKMKS